MRTDLKKRVIITLLSLLLLSVASAAAFHQDFSVGAVTGYHSHAADVIQYALGMEESGPIEILHPQDSAYPTLTCRYANGTRPSNHYCLSAAALCEMGPGQGDVCR